MNIDEIYTSTGSNLRTEDLGDKSWPLVIKEIDSFDFDEGTKIILRFEETDKGFVLNKTNARRIADMYGPDTDAWVGKKITLAAEDTEFGGKSVKGTRVQIERELASPDDEIPF